MNTPRTSTSPNQQDVKAAMQEGKEHLTEFAQRLEETSKEILANFQEKLSFAGEKIKNESQDVVTWVRANPVKSIVYGLAASMIIGKILLSDNSRRRYLN